MTYRFSCVFILRNSYRLLFIFQAMAKFKSYRFITEFIIIIYSLFTIISSVSSTKCDRRPYGAVTQASTSDGRFKLELVDAMSYIPEQLYTVRLSSTDGESLFTDFMITAEGEQRRNPQTRRTMTMDAGLMSPKTEDTKHTINRAGCYNTVEQQNSIPRDVVEVYWTAPKSGSGCVTIRAMVAINDVVWFEDGAPLTQRICEDLNQPDDIAPIINQECSVCEDAKYEISFTGHWSRNTHPLYYPENDEITAYSKMIGASHSIEWSPWIAGGMASEGLKELAEYANGSKLEMEIFEKISEGHVRTLIKGKGHKGYEKMSLPAYSHFRTDKAHHLVTVAVAIYPSPDWFLGVSRFELCSSDNKWLEERELNLYPWDAGTDNGVSYESPNNPTYPPDVIERVKMSSYDKNSPFFEIDMKDLHPFGQLHLKLIRTYDRGGCEEKTEEGGETPSPEEGGGEGAEEPSEPEEPFRYQNHQTGGGGGEVPLTVDPDATDDCPVSQWAEWSTCDGPCEDGYIEGFKNRVRYYMVDGEPMLQYDPERPEGKDLEIPKQCDGVDMSEVEECKEMEECSEEGYDRDPTVNRRVMSPVAPGYRWSSKKRNVKQKQPPSFLPAKENEW